MIVTMVTNLLCDQPLDVSVLGKVGRGGRGGERHSPPDSSSVLSLRWDQALTAADVLVQAAVVYSLARAEKSSASFACHTRAASVIARCAAIRSSTALRR